MINKEPRLHALWEQPGIHIPIYQLLYMLSPQSLSTLHHAGET